jgi:hypothetical protein
VFQPLLAKHSKSFSLVDAISIGVDRMQRNFEPMWQQVETWRQTELTTVTAKMIIYQAFIKSELEVPRHLARRVHDLYFSPQYPEFEPRTLWSLSNAFTSAFKDLDPIPQFRATAKLGELSRYLFQAELLKPEGRIETAATSPNRGVDKRERKLYGHRNLRKAVRRTGRRWPYRTPALAVSSLPIASKARFGRTKIQVWKNA